MPAPTDKWRGFTLVELLLALVLTAMLLTALYGLVDNALGTEDSVDERQRLQRDARFAMQRMVSNIERSTLLILPTPDDPATNWREHVREQTVPASPPEGSSTLATAVLAIALPASVDLDADGFADADNDRDGRVDEDYPADVSNDAAPGITSLTTTATAALTKPRAVLPTTTSRSPTATRIRSMASMTTATD